MKKITITAIILFSCITVFSQVIKHSSVYLGRYLNNMVFSPDGKYVFANKGKKVYMLPVGGSRYVKKIVTDQ